MRKSQGTQPQYGFWSGALFGTVTGMASLLTFQYLFGILRRPRLLSTAILLGQEEFENEEALGLFIAAESLRSGIQPRRLTHTVSKEIVHAGYRNFSESWARDFGFAAYGLLALKQYNPVKETLESFLWHQTRDGQLPVKLHSVDVVTRFLHSFFGREQPNELLLKPKYISGHGAPSLDGQALLVIAALAYSEQSGNIRFLQNHWAELRLAMRWLENYRKGTENDPLLHQGAFADWADSIARHGRVLYTNVVYWKALSEMAIAATRLNMQQEAVYYFVQAENVVRAINKRFWRADLGYFITSDTLTQLSSDGNLLAIAWGLAKRQQAESILKVMENARMAEPVPTRVTHPAYPRKLIALENLLGGMATYHTSASWLWIGAWHVIALSRTGHLEQAEKLVDRILNVIVEDRQVNEVHAPNGKPLASMWYTPEAPLTWNAGMVIYACRIFESKRQEEHKLLPIFHKSTE
ncbi:MAG TPA: glycoside hydrolase family 15 protein [Anaerolineales bacterium]|nr:glycoside hydrolase family 15 protein [Anaerolineales bacterium]